MRLLASFFRRFWRYRRRLALGLLCIPFGAAGDVALTVAIGRALDVLRESARTDFLGPLFLLLVGIGAARGVFKFAQRWWIISVSRYVEVELKQEVFDKLTSLSFSYHDRSRSGDVVSRLTSDVEHVRMFLGPGLMFLFGALITLPEQHRHSKAVQESLAEISHCAQELSLIHI